MSTVQSVGGSYRDPCGRVYDTGTAILRSINQRAVENFHGVRASGFIQSLIDDNQLLPERILSDGERQATAIDAPMVLAHPRLPFISYPFEWCFSALKCAALFHLDLHVRCLQQNITLVDASAYNVQFQGCEPIFMDHLSFRPYRAGEWWLGHKQFCEQFLNPLLLHGYCGVAPQRWFRGNLEGIPTEDLARLLPFKRKCSWSVLKHVVLPASLQRCSQKGAPSKPPVFELPKAAYEKILKQLRRLIEKIHLPGKEATVWQAYAEDNSYDGEQQQFKETCVKGFIARVAPQQVWDLGCNSGDYSVAALEAGAQYVIGFDFDGGVLNKAFHRARAEKRHILPLYHDLSNPTPALGWASKERMSLSQRAPADALLGLAFIHHLAIGKNVPFDGLIPWLMALAPVGCVEFVPKSDPMVKRMLQLREDVFTDYTEAAWIAALERHGKIIERIPVPRSGRLLFQYECTR